MADAGGCSANEATSFPSVSVAKRLGRIVRVVAATAALPFNRCDNDHCVVYTSPPPTAEPLLKEKPLGWVHFSACTKRCVPPHPLRSAQHLPPSGGRLLLSCISSCLTNLTNDRTQPRLIPASNHAPWQRTAQLDAGLAQPDQRGKQEANGGKLAFIRAVQAFSCHGGTQHCRLSA